MCRQILSFDVGVRNLAYCVIIDDAGKQLKAWDNVDIKGSTKDATTDKLMNLLDHIAFDLLDVNRPIVILVENQPRRASNLMKHIQIHISAYFKILGYFHALVSVKLHDIHPNRKLTMCLSQSRLPKGTRQKQYKSNKQAAVHTVSQLLRGPCADVDISDELKHKFYSTKKKDDLADCLLQAMSSI